jgi:rhodanese-related sulfurtransferase
MTHRLSVVLLGGLLACGSLQPAPAAPGPAPASVAAVRTVDVAGLAAARDRGEVPLLLDVRTPGEFAGGHVPGAVNVPLDALDGRLADLAPHRDGEIYVICQSGGRSAVASERLAAAGFEPVNVAGGTSAWRAAGHAVE